jgi:hypothetical protein
VLAFPCGCVSVNGVEESCMMFGESLLEAFQNFGKHWNWPF